MDKATAKELTQKVLDNIGKYTVQQEFVPGHGRKASVVIYTINSSLKLMSYSSRYKVVILGTEIGIISEPQHVKAIDSAIFLKEHAIKTAKLKQFLENN